MLSMGVYGLMMAGWASANNYALLGGQRAAALMISAEVAIGASIMGVVMVYGSLNMQDIARGQGQPLLPHVFGDWIPAWGILTQPLETRDAWLVRDPDTGSGWPQLILRIGYGLPVPASPRRPLRDVLEAPPRGKYPE